MVLLFHLFCDESSSSVRVFFRLLPRQSLCSQAVRSEGALLPEEARLPPEPVLARSLPQKRRLTFNGSHDRHLVLQGLPG